jgi:hypothetical protein
VPASQASPEALPRAFLGGCAGLFVVLILVSQCKYLGVEVWRSSRAFQNLVIVSTNKNKA